MPLPTPVLDDRRFQQIVDQAKKLIPQYCPEWTDHNVSDPGITLIELFAWMTEMLLYRVNQVPDKMYIKFLEMLGVRLEPPRAARAPMTFYLSAAQPKDISIPAGAEVATVRTDSNPPVVFTTETTLEIRRPEVVGAFTHSRSSDKWTRHDLRRLSLPGHAIQLFPAQPAPGDAFYLALARDHSRHLLALVLDCDLAGGRGVDPTNPPLEWQVWQGRFKPWATCELEVDSTGGFNQSGEVIVHLPDMEQRTVQGKEAFWLRCHLTDRQAGRGGYEVSPNLKKIEVEARGGTVNARHAVTVCNEPVGESDGTPGQSFTLRFAPLLARDPDRDYLVVTPPDGRGQKKWQEVADFADSRPEDGHFTLDSRDGMLALGPALLQPDGSVYRFGAVPPKGSKLHFSRYQHGGGTEGNVLAGTLTVLKASIPYITRVTNRAPAVGGRNAQDLEDAKLRAPQVLRTRTRAVTADDYEYLASQVEGVARAHCLAPGAQPERADGVQPGQVVVVIVPEVDPVTGPIKPDQLVPSAELRAAVLHHLDGHRVLGTSLDVRPPQYIHVAVQATLRLSPTDHPARDAEVQRRAAASLYRYLNPYLGGPAGNGWPFGRDLHVSEVYGLLQRIHSVEFVEDVRLELSDPGRADQRSASAPRLSVPRDGLICSGEHHVAVAVMAT